ncbi:tetratricopeptide repeat protein [Sphingomonas bacterium]|uniref:tetratricopeptide repeat protein n=1 Tax=Sphingomonas bacterium TaxID=1895847 RepID=UPI001576E3A0|nr:hypothetical protein [Sphingomonas bacterium]
MRHIFPIPFPPERASRPASRLAAVLAALALASCGQNIPKADAYEAQADGMMTAQAYPVAVDMLQKSVKYDSNEPRRWVKLGRAQRALNMPALAAMSFQHALDLDPANIESLQNLSILEVRAGRYDDAKSYVDPLMSLSPDDVAGLLALGAIALYQKRLPEGLGYAERLIKIAPSSLGGYSLKAHVLDAMGRPAAAAKVLAQQALFNPDDKDLALQLLTLYQRAGDVEGVRTTAINLARLVPDDPRYQMEAARAFFARGDRAKADGIIAAIVRRYLYHPDIMLAVAQYWQATMPADAAIARITALAQGANGRTKAGLCDLLVRLGKVQAVLAMLKPIAADEVSAGNADVLASYAGALFVTGKLDQAKKIVDDVLTFDGQVDTALIVRARIALMRKQYAAALTDAQLAATDNIQNAQAAILVPQIYAAWGNRLLAGRTWGDAQAHLPDDVLVLGERVKWLLATKQADIAKGLTADFSRGHARNPQAWLLYQQACVAAKDDDCAARAAAALAALKKRGG